MLVRPMELPDVPKVAQIYTSTVQSTYSNLVSNRLLFTEEESPLLEDFYASFLGSDCPILVADNGSGVCGFCRKKERPKKACEIIQLYVDPCMQGKGVGKSLVSHLEESEAYKVLQLLVLEGNDSAIGFYQKYGFLPTGIKRFLPQFKVHELGFQKILK